MPLPFGHRVPFVTHLGFTLERFEAGEAELHYTALAEHLNNHGMTHGGACMTLLDVAMAAATRSAAEPDTGVVTVEMKTTFMQPASGPLVASGRMLHRTGRMAFAEGTLRDAQGRICAHATGTFKFVQRKPPAPLATD